MILHLRQKMKDDLSQKNKRKYDIFFKLSKKVVFAKRAAQGHDLSCIIWRKDGIFFPKTYFFIGQKLRGDLSQETYGNMTFFVYTYTYKRQRWSYSVKIHLKVIDVLDWHPRKSSSNSLYFHGYVKDRKWPPTLRTLSFKFRH